jgi:hypothetical protein
MTMNADNRSDTQAFVQTAEQTGGFVWVITLVDFGSREVKRSLVSDGTYETRAAAKDAGDAHLKALAADH